MRKNLAKNFDLLMQSLIIGREGVRAFVILIYVEIGVLKTNANFYASLSIVQGCIHLMVTIKDTEHGLHHSYLNSISNVVNKNGRERERERERKSVRTTNSSLFLRYCD